MEIIIVNYERLMNTDFVVAFFCPKIDKKNSTIHILTIRFLKLQRAPCHSILNRQKLGDRWNIIVRCRFQQYIDSFFKTNDLRESHNDLSSHTFIFLTHKCTDTFAPVVNRMKIHIEYLLAGLLRKFIEHIAIGIGTHHRWQDYSGPKDRIDDT